MVKEGSRFYKHTTHTHTLSPPISMYIHIFLFIQLHALLNRPPSLLAKRTRPIDIL